MYNNYFYFTTTTKKIATEFLNLIPLIVTFLYYKKDLETSFQHPRSNNTFIQLLILLSKIIKHTQSRNRSIHRSMKTTIAQPLPTCTSSTRCLPIIHSARRVALAIRSPNSRVGFMHLRGTFTYMLAVARNHPVW